jgi:hypothetical protein
VISTLLVALVVRALIPAGFMPATDRPFSFQICPDGFPAQLLQDLAASAARADGSAAANGHAGESLAATAGDSVALAGQAMPAGHHHHGDSDMLAAADRHDDGGMLAPTAVHHADGDALAAAAEHDNAGHAPASFAHHHDSPAHNHSSASAEHCVFAAAAGVFALAFAAAFSAPATTTLGTPDVPYVSPAVESRRFTLPQPRGPPTFS